MEWIIKYNTDNPRELNLCVQHKPSNYTDASL